MKKLVLLLLLLLALPVPAASADGSSFAETQSADDQLFHIDVSASHVPNVGTIKISLPGAVARFDPALQVEPAGYSCQVTTSAYGEPNTGFVCSTEATVDTVTVHLLSQHCYSPPPEGSAQFAVAQVWTAPADPGTPPDASFALHLDMDCSGTDQLAVDNFSGARCVVPKLSGLTLRKATQKLKTKGCARGKVSYVKSAKVKKGRIVKQSAKAGKKLKLGAKVRLVVSRGK